MADKMFVKNSEGQVSGFDISGPQGAAREAILRQRILRGELSEAKSGAKSDQPGGDLTPVVEDYQTGLRDEKNDLLRSIHGGGLDPDAKGDALGQPSGSEHVDGMVKLENEPLPIGDSHPAAAVDAPNSDADLPDDPSTGGAPTAASAKGSNRKS